MTTVEVTKVLSIGMGGFDTLAMADRYFGNGNIAALNSKLHESTAYNVFQTDVTALAIFTGGMTTSMKCFVAGTMILTAEGLVAIENIKAGDMVLSRNPETGEISYKKVEISFVNQANKLAHVTVNGETIVSTHDHPYYVKDRGFVNACDLWIGAELIDRKGVIHPVEQIYRENLSEDSVNVYNFKVEDFHTYYSGNTCVLVHNSDCGGRYGSLKDDKQGRQFENEEIHHMPADSASVLSKRDGVAIRMDKSDHRFTASYDRKRGSSEYRAMQKKLISEGRFQEAFDMDVADIQKNFPGKYDKSIQQAQKYLDSLFKAGKL